MEEEAMVINRQTQDPDNQTEKGREATTDKSSG